MAFTIDDAKELGANCDECPLAGHFNGVPTTYGNSDDLAFVGEAPGIVEARQGKSLVGPSGRLLDIVLDHHGINRNEVTLTNACLCRPADGGTPPKSAIQACRPRVLQELRDTETIVAMGNSAALSVLGTEGITKLRIGPGKESGYEELHSKRIIPTVHPAACLRQSDMFPFLVTDIGKIHVKVHPYVKPEWQLLDTKEKTLAYLEEVRLAASVTVVDIEVDIEKDTAYDHPNHYEMLCIGLNSDKVGIGVISQEMCALEEVRDALYEALVVSKIICQNGMFDLAGLYPIVGFLPLYFDTMLASYCLDERPGIHGLKAQAIEYLGMPEYDAHIHKYVKGEAGEGLDEYHGYGRIPRDELYEYNALDLDATYKLFLIQEVRLAALGKPDWWDEWWHGAPFKSLRDMHDFLVSDGIQLMFLELNGIKIDRERNKELTDQYLESLDTIKTRIQKTLADSGYKAADTFNPNSPIQVKAALKHLSIAVPDTGKETIQRVKEFLQKNPDETGTRDYALEYIEDHQVFKKEAKLYGTYVKGITKRMYAGKIHSSYLLHGTTTGRLASRNPNMQNIPRLSMIKNQFVPTRGVFVQADYSQAELRVLTWMAQEEYFREILNDDSRDLFDELTPGLYGEDAVKDNMSEEEWKELRIRVKAFVYGLGYGRTHFTIASEFKMPEKEAERMKNNFFALIPNIVDFQTRIRKHVQGGSDLITPFGRHRRFHLITKENWKSVQNEALAFLPQSTSSDLCLRAMARVRRELSGSGAYVRNIVHDSILVDCTPDAADDIAKLLDQHMVASARELVGDYVEFKTDTKIGPTWGDV